ncbi:MAG: PD-(D/E)XK nuclease family transposase, partial [Deltaproteobacteria bacterium]|nr:PD-(D/E)XK nuclease family transposase [Deltaproteobacteria bacterium]
MLHFLDLTAFRKMATIVQGRLKQWLTWFCLSEGTMKGLDTLLESNPAIKEAHELYTRFTADNELMEKYEARQKYLRDVSTIKHVSHDEGYTKGLAEGEVKGFTQGEVSGLEKGKRQTVVAMRKEHIDPATISRVTGLSI